MSATASYYASGSSTLDSSATSTHDSGNILVLVPPEDPICDYNKARKFFGPSVVKDVSVPGARHGFIEAEHAATGKDKKKTQKNQQKKKPLLNEVVPTAVKFFSQKGEP
uniref:Uncharacterized protein n=1 Tax=Grammatophora oceanica TaxID=210454 RepID=A0A7S1VUC2_9STRA|mmetsp:Transcript_7617/g.11118  ORF Transcript_7617/g.11118 Transcript_7617/m.11118 type:complete len:109 (+) Transcript_7617:2-328(+)